MKYIIFSMSERLMYNRLSFISVSTQNVHSKCVTKSTVTCCDLVQGMTKICKLDTEMHQLAMTTILVIMCRC